MSQSYFQFKQFRIEQGRCAMKVSTDACIQGAWTPLRETDKRVLDVGAGTGLLSLVLAQRAPQIQVDAVELDTAAAEQAAENAAASPFANRIQVLQGDVRAMALEPIYDLLICNPPFFTRSLIGPDSQRNQARHDASLTLANLYQVAERVLIPDGRLCVLLPALEMTRWEHIMQTAGWNLQYKLSVQSKDTAAVGRVISVWGREVSNVQEETLVIYKGQNQLTDAAIELLRPFYLHL